MAIALFGIGAARARPTVAAADVPFAMLCECTATSVAAAPDEVIVVRVAGEVDLYTVAVLRDALADSLARGPCALLIDVAAMTFCDVRGLTLLVQTAATATERGIDYAITAAPRQARRVWSMLWPADEVPIQYPSAAAGILAAMSRQTRGNRTDDVARWAPKHSPGWTRHWPTARPTGAADRGLMITERLSGPPS